MTQAPPMPAQEKKPAAAAEAAVVPVRRVLIVDDNELACKQLQTLLQVNPALQVSFVTDGHKALEALEKDNVSVMVDRPAHAEARWHGPDPRDSETPASRNRHCHHRARQHRRSGPGDPSGRLRLSAQAGRRRASAPGHRPRSARTDLARRGRAASFAATDALCLPEHLEQEPAHALGLRTHQQRRRHEHHDPHRRRDRHRQGAGRAGHPRRRPRTAAGRSSPSTARHSPRRCSKANSSATRKARSPAPSASANGRFELANGGTIFLDEIGDVPAGHAGEAVARAARTRVRTRRRHRSRSRSTSASSPRRTESLQKMRAAKASFARICSIV